MKNFFSLFYMFKFIVFGSLATYSYYVGSKLFIGWIMLSILSISEYIICEIKKHQK